MQEQIPRHPMFRQPTERSMASQDQDGSNTESPLSRDSTANTAAKKIASRPGKLQLLAMTPGGFSTHRSESKQTHLFGKRRGCDGRLKGMQDLPPTHRHPINALDRVEFFAINFPVRKQTQATICYHYCNHGLFALSNVA